MLAARLHQRVSMCNQPALLSTTKDARFIYATWPLQREAQSSWHARDSALSTPFASRVDEERLESSPPGELSGSTHAHLAGLAPPCADRLPIFILSSANAACGCTMFGRVATSATLLALRRASAAAALLRCVASG